VRVTPLIDCGTPYHWQEWNSTFSFSEEKLNSPEEAEEKTCEPARYKDANKPHGHENSRLKQY